MLKVLPAIFVSHGAPSLLLEQSPARDFLAGLGRQLGRPRAIVCMSSHWVTPRPRVTASLQPETIYDFYGFPDPLYEIKYPARGSSELASVVSQLLKAAGMPCDIDGVRGLDHGAWVPLSLMYPQANVPVIQLSVQTPAGPSAHILIGRTLKPLRDEGVLLMGTGSSVHNLSLFPAEKSKTPEWAIDFEQWLYERLVCGDEEDLIRYRTLRKEAVLAHPTEEHFLPLFFAFGAGGKHGQTIRLHHSFSYGVLGMSCYSFGN
jgi:4,5-DOPA dioxygenase extradiol